MPGTSSTPSKWRRVHACTSLIIINTAKIEKMLTNAYRELKEASHAEICPLLYSHHPAPNACKRRLAGHLIPCNRPVMCLQCKKTHHKIRMRKDLFQDFVANCLIKTKSNNRHNQTSSGGKKEKW